MARLPADIHLHSKLCGHAVGEIDEYVERAIELGLAAVGFSFHLPITIPVPYKVNVTREELDFLATEVTRLRAKYGAAMPILLGGEADYLPDRVGEAAELAAAYPFDYLMGSVHFIGDWPFDHPANVGGFDQWNHRKLYETYFGLVCDAMRTGLFNVVGHVDLIKKFGHRLEGDWSDIMREVCSVARERGLALEVNTAGFDKPVGEQYASEDFLRLAFAAGVPITFGSDAHAPGEVGRHFARAIALARGAGYSSYAYFEKRKFSLVSIESVIRSP